ncbi:ketopantoate reductase family protein [Oceanospirillum maris]|jgi:2-dehydropantoate 2-reductase|uniref:ketopantoate reductase family protein n=1 Tax=Oceanospirillum maris TaxID=64977 RepID=UPI0003FDBD64|nr:2-dehydropantoate 2-reductase [Oceanospirillum maris]
MSQTHWTVLGAGSLGCLWAGYLNQAGYPVTLLHRKGVAAPESLSLTRYNAVQAESFHAHLTTAPDCLEKSISRLVVATKAQDALAAVAGIAHALTDNAAIILLQNGMGAQQAIAEKYPDHPVIAVCITDGAYRTDPGHVIHAGQGISRVGAMNALGKAVQADLVNELSKTDLVIESCDDINQALWNKLAINIAINGLTALYQCLNGELIQPERYRRVERLCAETESIMRALQLKLPDNGLLSLARDVIAGTAQNRSSMLQDTLKGKITEIDYINGFLIDQANRLGIAVPESQIIFDEVKQCFNQPSSKGVV